MMRRFIGQTILFGTLFLIIYLFLVVLAAKSIFIEHSGIHNYLYRYQVEKIHSSSDCNTIFIGDSSLGNAINSDHFAEMSGLSSMNLALTGDYGYAGSYNMLKKAHSYHPDLRNVIVMHTVDMSTRGVSFGGYAKTITNLRDIIELSFRDMKIVLPMLFDLSDVHLAEQYDYASYISHDYVRQGGKNDFEGHEIEITENKLNRNKGYFLKKIVAYCDVNDLNLVYVHGPLYDGSLSLSGQFIQAANHSISSTGIELAELAIGVPNAKLGDSDDHVNPQFKDEYTSIYYRLIAPLLDQIPE